jgi:hypothetical protein
MRGITALLLGLLALCEMELEFDALIAVVGVLTFLVLLGPKRR